MLSSMGGDNEPRDLPVEIVERQAVLHALRQRVDHRVRQRFFAMRRRRRRRRQGRPATRTRLVGRDRPRRHLAVTLVDQTTVFCLLDDSSTVVVNQITLKSCRELCSLSVYSLE